MHYNPQRKLQAFRFHYNQIRPNLQATWTQNSNNLICIDSQVPMNQNSIFLQWKWSNERNDHWKTKGYRTYLTSLSFFNSMKQMKLDQDPDMGERWMIAGDQRGTTTEWGSFHWGLCWNRNLGSELKMTAPHDDKTSQHVLTWDLTLIKESLVCNHDY